MGIDEVFYFDYALKSPSLGIRIGEQVGVESMTTAACRMIVDWQDRFIPECGDPHPNPDHLWQQGYNVAFQHPPAYFSITAIGAKVTRYLPWVESKLVAYRLVGAAWLMAGIALLWYALTVVGLGTVSKAAAVSLMAAPPMAIYSAAQIHAANTQLTGGGMVLVALVLWEAGRWRWWSVPAAATAAMWLNLNNASAVGAVVAYLIYRVWRERHLMSELLRMAASSFALAVASVAGWQLWQHYRKLADAHDLPIHQYTYGWPGFHWQQIHDELRAVLTPFRQQWLQTWEVLMPLSGVVDIFLMATMAGALAVTAHRPSHRYLVAGVFTAMIGTGVVTMLSTYFAGYNYWIRTPGRYGLALLPLAALAISPVLGKIVAARMAAVALAVAIMVAVFGGALTSASPPLERGQAELIKQKERELLLEERSDLIDKQEQFIQEQQELIRNLRGRADG